MTQKLWIGNICVDMFLDYFNNFLSVEKFAEHYAIPEDLAKQIIKFGRHVHERNVEQGKVK